MIKRFEKYIDSILKNSNSNFKTNKFLTIKAKYHVIEPYYMEGSTPDHLTAFVNEPECERR